MSGLSQDASLLTTFVKSGSLSYRSLPASLDVSGHSLQTSVINKVFSPTELPLTGSFVLNTDTCKLKVTALGSKWTLCPVLFFFRVNYFLYQICGWY